MAAEITPEILIVDDEKFTHALLVKALGELNVRTVSVFSGQEALDTVAMHDFSVVLMDLRMPGMDGIETARKIRNTPRTSDLPIIFVTAVTGDEEKAREAYELGAVDFLFKPVSAAVLRSKVSVFGELFKRRKELQQRNEQYRDILEAVAEGLLTLDLDWNVVEANDSACLMFGYSHDEIQGRHLSDLLSLEAEDLVTKVNDLLETTVSFEIEARGHKRDQSCFWVEFKGSIFMFGGAPHVLAVTHNITPHKEAESRFSQSHSAEGLLEQDRTYQIEELESKLEHLKQMHGCIMETWPTPLFFTNAHGKYLDCNHEFAALFGMPPERVTGMYHQELHPREVSVFFQQKDRELLADMKRQEFEITIFSPSGARNRFRAYRCIFPGPENGNMDIITVLEPAKDCQ